MTNKEAEPNPLENNQKINTNNLFQTHVDTNYLKNEKKEEAKLLGKKTKRNGKKINNEYCAACEKGDGNLLPCNECVRSYHMECLKLTEKDLPEGAWLCPICTLKKEKKEKKEKRVAKPKPNLKTEKENPEKPKKVNTRTRRGKKANNKENINKENIKENNKEAINKEVNKPNNNVNKEKPKENNKENKTGKKKGRAKKNVGKNKNNNVNNVNNANASAPAAANNITNNEKINNENKDTNITEEEYYGESNLISKTDLINFLKNLSQKDIKNINELNLTDEISKILKNSNSIKAISSLINTNKELSKYKNTWNLLIEKKNTTTNNSRHAVHYPIKCKDLYSNPERHGLEEKYFNKSKGTIYPYINGKQFTRLINIYDFLITFSSKIYLNKFTLEEFYSALVLSEKHTNSEICLLSSIHISVVYALVEELCEIPLQEIFTYREIELLILKSVLDTKKDDLKKLYSFIYYTWPELVRLFLLSKIFIKDYSLNFNIDSIIDKLYNTHDILAYNTSLNFEEKLTVLEKLVVISYETNYIRYGVKEGQDQKNKYKKAKKELDDELKDIESRKNEFERHSKFTQPQLRIEEINKKLEEFQQNKNSKPGNEKMKVKLEIEKKELEKMVKEINDNNVRREDLLNKIEELKEEIFDLPTIGRAYLGVDGRGFKYYYFTWMPKVLFIRNKKEKNEIQENNEKYEWRIINNEEELNKEIIDKLSEKGIEELRLKNKLVQVAKKFKNKNDSENKENKIIVDEENKIQKENNKNEITIEDIFKNQVLKYQNSKNPIGNDKQYKIVFITEKTNQYEPISEKLKKIEINISRYLSLDNRQWESPKNRSKVKSWISTIKTINNFVNILLFFNERIKIPYKSEILSIADSLFGKSATRKIIEEDKNEDKDENNSSKGGCPLIVNGNFDPNYINRDLQYANRIKLWTKEYETYNIEKIYLEYLKNAKSIPRIIICTSMFEIVVNELNTRREFSKKKGDNFIPEIMKNDENKINFGEMNNNGLEGLTNIEIKNPKIKKKTLIEWIVKCMFCHEFGELLCCEDCPNVAHLSCAKMTKLPDVWKCSYCANNRKLIK